MSAEWKAIAAKKKADQEALIPKEWKLSHIPPSSEVDVLGIPETCGLLDTTELEITNAEVDVLLEKLAKGQWTSVAVTTAFYKRAIIAHQLTNCLTEIFIEEALKRATELDEHLKSTGKVVGPLHGLPVSLKDQINIKGVDSCMGYISWIGKPAAHNAVLTDILESVGAVPFVKTNIPQTLMWAETYNLVFGRTTNPHNRTLTCGGSSGGEGALIAMRGSPIGVGSDIGGSVRIPAAFCGAYGLRPSYGRVPYARCVNSLEGQDSVPSVLGPLANTLSGIKIFMKTIADARPWLKDPLAVRKRWSEEEYNLADHGGGRNMTFAILWDDGLVKPHPPITRGLETVKKVLLNAGHQVLDWKPLKHAEIYKTMAGIYAAGSQEDYEVTTSSTGEPVLMTMSPEDETPAPIIDSVSLSAYQLWQLHKKKRDIRGEYLQHWEDTVKQTGTGRAVDAIIAPVAPYTAPPHGKNNIASYTMIYNFLDYTSLVIPISKVDPKLDKAQVRQEFYGEMDKANWECYNPDTYKNAPIAVQLVGRTLEEEAVIAMGEIVDAALNAVQQKKVANL